MSYEAAERRKPRIRRMKTQSILKYKNIPTIYDVIEDNRTCYIIMEYINGTNLYNFMNNEKRSEY